MIVTLLTRDTDVDVAEYRREEENTIVRLTGSDPADLEAVANALWHRVWEEGFQQRTQLIENRGDVGTQINVAGDYLAPRELPELVARLEALQKVGGDLSALRDVLERIELRLGQGEAEVRREWTKTKSS
ncbi:MAG: hypothetical protein H6716_24700 [Polyangiaceae bacterium]|nr:hypothetical protein [Polyangiaceae bacterium]